jgi:hypothetical protein
MHEQIVDLHAPHDHALYLWFEPWAEGLSFPAGTRIQLIAKSSVPGELEVAETPESTAIYGWSRSTLQVLVANTVVLSFDQPVPDMLDRKNVTMLFGAPPVPTTKERARYQKPAWWRFWA